MNEVSMRERDAAPVTWGELKIELNEIAALLARLWLSADDATKTEVQALAQTGNGVLAFLLSAHLGPPPASGG